jgi:hypothetical protein
MDRDTRNAIKEMVRAARQFQGNMWVNEFPDIFEILILACLIDIYKRVERVERWLLEDGF